MVPFFIGTLAFLCIERSQNQAGFATGPEEAMATIFSRRLRYSSIPMGFSRKRSAPSSSAWRPEEPGMGHHDDRKPRAQTALTHLGEGFTPVFPVSSSRRASRKSSSCSPFLNGISSTGVLMERPVCWRKKSRVFPDFILQSPPPAPRIE